MQTITNDIYLSVPTTRKEMVDKVDALTNKSKNKLVPFGNWRKKRKRNKEIR